MARKEATGIKVSRHSLLFGLSYALDIMGKNNPSHSKSTAYLSIGLAHRLGLSRETITDIFYAALLHDIGISDEHIKKTVYAVDMRRHCAAGYAMVERCPLSNNIARYIRYHHESYDGTGPFKLSGAEIPKGAEIIGLASLLDDDFGKTEYFDHGVFAQIKGWVEPRKNWFSPELVNAFLEIIEREHFLLDYFNRETKHLLHTKIADSENIYYQIDDIKKFACCFAGLIDQRTPSTFYHSTGLSERAVQAAAHLGHDVYTQDIMQIAGLLHDIGKLHIDPAVLHKDGPLSPSERFEMNKHSYYTRKVLERIDGFEEIVDIAANHHERMDGSGYPYRIPGEELGELERVMAICDIYQALTEKRPYREEMSPSTAWKIIDNMAANNHLDRSLTEKLKGAFL